MWFEPRYRRQARHLLHAARKLWNYRRDRLAPAAAGPLVEGMARLRAALKSRDRAAIERESAELDAVCVRLAPPPADASLRENVEVILIALIVVFGGIRPYVAQPFKIPTGSMQPTLNGIIVHAADQPLPNPAVRLFHLVWYGRSYFRVAAPSGGAALVEVGPARRFLLFPGTRIRTDQGSHTIPGAYEAMRDRFGLAVGRRYASGETIASGWIDAGDWLFVDKVRYHFRRPSRGESFVFRTAGIQGLSQGQYYIKRLAGLPGDELRIDPPRLFVNGVPAAEPGLARVAAARDGYAGYTNGGGTPLLGSPTATFRVPPDRYFALGDNSRNSLDGRYWGTVPAENLVGPALLVYWPFGHHFGLVR